MSLSERIGLPGPQLLACLAAVCLAIGVISGVDPTYGLLAALGLLFAVVALMDVTLGFVLFVLVSFLDLASSTGTFSGTKVIALVVFVSWLARIGTRRGADLAAFISENGALTAAMVALVIWSCLSFTWASSPGTALAGGERYALGVMLVPIAFTAVRRREHVIWVLTAFVIGTIFSGAWGLLHPTTTGTDAGRLTGTAGDSNYEAAVLAAAIPLVISLGGIIRRSARLKVVTLVGLVLLFASLVDTLSRGGLISLGAIMVAAVIFGGRWRRQTAIWLVIGVAVTLGYFFILAPVTARQRVTMSDTSGRSSIWKVALRVFEAHPVLGVGTDNFILVERQYVNRPGSVQAGYIVTAPRVTHNVFLEAAADLGVPGLITIVAVFALALGAAARAAWLFEAGGNREMELISRAVVLALVGLITSDFFVSNPYAKYLWIVIAMCPVLLRIARQDAAAAAADRTAAPVARRRSSSRPRPEPGLAPQHVA